MKHLKLFENHNQYYQRIEPYDYYNYINWGLLDMSKDEIDKINLTFKKYLPTYMGKYSTHPTKNRNILEQIQISVMIDTDTRYTFFISKNQDEWYLVRIWDKIYTGSIGHYVYYKCDQFEGLIKFLNDIKWDRIEEVSMNLRYLPD